MPLNAGNRAATQGMAQAIYISIDAELRPPMEADMPDPEEALPPIQDAWRALAFAVATGVVSHLERQPATQPEYAETFSSEDQDEEFWEWMRDFTSLLEGWAGGAGTVVTLRTALSSFLGSNPVPEQLRGVLR